MMSNVNLEMKRRDMNEPNIIQKRIQTQVEGDWSKLRMKQLEEYSKNFEAIMEEIRKNEYKKPGKFQLLPNHQSSEDEFRHLNLLFTKNYA